MSYTGHGGKWKTLSMGRQVSYPKQLRYGLCCVFSEYMLFLSFVPLLPRDPLPVCAAGQINMCELLTQSARPFKFTAWLTSRSFTQHNWIGPTGPGLPSSYVDFAVEFDPLWLGLHPSTEAAIGVWCSVYMTDFCAALLVQGVKKACLCLALWHQQKPLEF